MRVKKEKRNFWLSSEVDCMLTLIKELQTVQGTTSTTHYTFVQIANKMKMFGFPNKSPTQIRRKWFQMKSAYLCFRRGNKDRLLLIPEKFRKDIAQFVEAEYRGGPKPSSSIESDPVTPPNYKQIKPLPAVPKIEPSEKKIITVPKFPEIKKTSTAAIKVEPSNANSYNSNDTYNNYYEKFMKFLSRLKIIQKSLNEDFTQRQKALLEYEHELQKERDSHIIQSLKRTTSLILASAVNNAKGKSNYQMNMW